MGDIKVRDVKTTFTQDAAEDYLWAQQTPDILKKVNALIEDIKSTPFKGIGKPEPLKGDLSGWWSRRITAEHRLVYRVTGEEGDQRLEIVACRYHY